MRMNLLMLLLTVACADSHNNNNEDHGHSQPPVIVPLPTATPVATPIPEQEDWVKAKEKCFKVFKGNYFEINDGAVVGYTCGFKNKGD